ncbi:MAG TPA: TauD/TfdA family dioxygenase [Candidatus Dormibacteraeota bacterium]|nr:TauD/TfdA family dioxygenase [Candidatus Dormibacteraeota bacterium]
MGAAAPFEYAPLSPHIGVEVHADLREELSPAQREQFVELYRRHHLLLFRGTPLSPEDQTRAVSYLGDALPGGYISNTRPEGAAGEGELEFHSDLTYMDTPVRGISLYGEDVEEGAPGTKYANAQRACSLLPDALRESLRDRTAVHVWMPAHSHKRTRESDMTERGLRATHPVLYAKPDTGEPVLLITWLATDRILDMPPAESDALLDELAGYIYRPDNIYEHVWRNHDLVIWDNLALQHARSNVRRDGPHRSLRRVAFAPSGGVEAATAAQEKIRRAATMSA